MIKVIVVDMKDGELQSEIAERERLKNNDYARMIFEENIHNMVKYFIDKIMKEPQED